VSQALPSSAKVAVIGAGTMGSGIAHVAARAGHEVLLFDASAEAIERGRQAIAKDLASLVGKGRLSEDEAHATLSRVHAAERLSDTRDAALIAEAISEDRGAKHELFSLLETMVLPDCILATNTSSISITELAQPLKHPGRLVGMHFFNPAPRMPLVEVISGVTTDPAMFDCVYETARAWGKTPVRARSIPGFIVNRVARPFYAEALRVLQEQAADAATLDAVMRECGGFAMGPFDLIDLIGLDVNLAVTRSVFEATAFDRRYAPSLIQQELVRAGRHGRKTGYGFHRYGEHAPALRPKAEPPCTPAEIVRAVGDLGPARDLLERLRSGGVYVEARGGGGAPGYLAMDAARLMLSDGRTATQRAAEEGVPNLVLMDLASDYARAPRVAVAPADQCDAVAYERVVGTLQSGGLMVSRLDDVAGLLVLRTVAMLANEAADLVAHGVAVAADIDIAMRLGVSYPKGPLAWADEIGPALVARVLDNLRSHYGEERYRVSPALQRRRWSGAHFHD
jgi:3-hydroxybutyryl-CoA dehydrogenase